MQTISDKWLKPNVRESQQSQEIILQDTENTVCSERTSFKLVSGSTKMKITNPDFGIFIDK